MPNRKHAERGMTLLEVVVTAAIMFVVLMAGMQVLLVLFGGREMDERTRRANDACDSALETLVTRVHIAPMSGGGSFTISGNTVTLAACSNSWCDQLLVDDAGTRRGDNNSFAGGTLWSSPIPAGTHREFVRRWRVDPVPFRPDVRQLTVAVFPNAESTEPLARISTRVAERKP